MAEEAPKEGAEAPKQDTAPAPQTARRSFPKRFSRAGHMGLGVCLSGILLTVVVILGLITLVAWLVYRPHRPRFYVDQALIYDLNVTDGSVTSNMQFMVLFQNPNKRWSIKYDRLAAFVTYRGQLITMATPLPSFKQAHRSVFPIYASVAGQFVPVYPEVAGGLAADEGFGLVELKLQIRGRFRWRTSMWRSARYHLYVTCDLLVGTKQRVNGQVPLFRGQRCDVDI